VIENNGVKVKFEGKGRVTKQSIAPGKRVGGVMNITLKLG